MGNSKISVRTIHTGNFKLDGGAMFGVVPKQLWNKLNPADSNNLCNWAMRCLLIQTEGRNILIDTGIGVKQSESFFSHYDLNGSQSLLSSLKSEGLEAEDITDVILTHLHFDHCGGAVSNKQGVLVPTFANAQYYVHKEQWDTAKDPNPREKASFLRENFEPLHDAGKIVFLEQGDTIADIIEIHVFFGHTNGMIAPLISFPDGKKLFYGADLFPSSAHIKPHFVMAYDVEPLKTMSERARINEIAARENWWYFYEHDLKTEISQVAFNEKGQAFPVNASSLFEVFI